MRKGRDCQEVWQGRGGIVKSYGMDGGDCEELRQGGGCIVKSYGNEGDGL